VAGKQQHRERNRRAAAAAARTARRKDRRAVAVLVRVDHVDRVGHRLDVQAHEHL
jgi:hypothetical protein